ncbi:MAG TPA: glycosyltransferase family 39 protein [Candidatus Saccharimonadales bacterium]|nr:glycosyltransferase family 39 protein [Candidatus Saccharimonadales bacterium]
MGKYITDYFLYAKRYLLGYGAISLAVIGLLLIAGLYVPGGITEGEMNSTVISSGLSIDSFDPLTIIDLPYHVLQRLSMEAFGISDLSIKLPSLILATVSIIGILLLLRMWFKGNVALLTTVLVVTTGQLLFIAQSGTPSIMYIFTTVWLLLAALLVSRRVSRGGTWKLVLFIIAAISLYTPLSIYIILALLSAVVLHPHLRYLVRRLSRVKVALAFVCALIIVAPLIYAIVKEPNIGLTLLGVPKTWPHFLSNGVQILKQYFDFITPTNGALITPIYGLGPMLLILLGALRLATTKYTARSYIISTWVILLLPVLLINPNFVAVTFVPVILLMAMGIDILLGNWYRLFPRNPYARIAGLVPLAVLIGGMVISGVDRYMYGYQYDPQTTSHFSHDLTLVNKELSSKDRGNTVLIPTAEDTAFYGAIVKHHKDVSISSSFTPTAKTVIVAKGATPVTDLTPERIVTSASSENADRLYVYKTGLK